MNICPYLRPFVRLLVWPVTKKKPVRGSGDEKDAAGYANPVTRFRKPVRGFIERLFQGVERNRAVKQSETASRQSISDRLSKPSED